MRAAARKAKAKAQAATQAHKDGAVGEQEEAPKEASPGATGGSGGGAAAPSPLMARLRKASVKLTPGHGSKLADALAAPSSGHAQAPGTLGAAASTHADAPALAPGSLQKAMGEVRGVNGMNTALWALGVFKHEPPKFEYFDPEDTEHLGVIMKEVRLPRAEQTHEVIFEPLTKCVFVSQMSNSVLVRIPVAEGGLLLDDQDAWHVGPVDDKGNGLGA